LSFFDLRTKIADLRFLMWRSIEVAFDLKS
jgi:hypothetical protein